MQVDCGDPASPAVTTRTSDCWVPGEARRQGEGHSFNPSTLPLDHVADESLWP